MGSHPLALTGPAGDPASPVHRLDPRAKVVGLVAVTVTAVATPLERWPVWAGCLALLLAYAAVGRVGPVAIWRRARIVAFPLALALAFIPLVRGWDVFAAVAAKASIGTLSAVLLGATTTFPDVLRGLERLRVPRLFVLIATMMYRYLFVIVEEVARTRAALFARGYHPRHALQAGPLGKAATTLFLRTYGRGERVHLAMLARGYDGRMPQLQALAFARADAAFLALCLGGGALGLLA